MGLGFTRRTPAVLFALASFVIAGCLEPNPNAGDTDAGTDVTSGDASTDTSADAGGCADCDFALESVSFEVTNSNTITIPKPDMPHTVPIAAISGYAPSTNVEDLGFSLSFSDAGSAYELSIELTGDAANSRVSGVAAVLGFADELGAPETEQLDVPVDGCASSSLVAGDGTIVLDVVSSYQPDGGAVLSYSRAVTDGVAEYCVTEASSMSASLGVWVIAFTEPSTGAIVPIDVGLDSGTPHSEDYGEVGASSAIAHIVSARALDEGTAPSMGYATDCSATSPYGCSFSLIDFNAGATASLGGALLAAD